MLDFKLQRMAATSFGLPGLICGALQASSCLRQAMGPCHASNDVRCVVEIGGARTSCALKVGTTWPQGSKQPLPPGVSCGGCPATISLCIMVQSMLLHAPRKESHDVSRWRHTMLPRLFHTARETLDCDAIGTTYKEVRGKITETSRHEPKR